MQKTGPRQDLGSESDPLQPGRSSSNVYNVIFTAVRSQPTIWFQLHQQFLMNNIIRDKNMFRIKLKMSIHGGALDSLKVMLILGSFGPSQDLWILPLVFSAVCHPQFRCNVPKTVCTYFPRCVIVSNSFNLWTYCVRNTVILGKQLQSCPLLPIPLFLFCRSHCPREKCPYPVPAAFVGLW